ncbi:PAS domain S-box protein [Verrucomicrobiota bacterium sgz303538]
MSGSRNCIQVLDLNGRVLSLNPDGQELLGIDTSGALSPFWPEWWADGVGNLAREALAQAQDGKDGHFEVFASFAGGAPRWWDVTVTRLPSDDGHPEQLLAVTRDLCERKASEQHLRESEERFRAAFDQSVMGIVLTDLNGVVQRANNAFCRIVGYSEEELMGHTSYQFTHPDDRENNIESVRRLREGVAGSSTYIKRYIHKDGGVVWTQINLSLVRNAEGQPSGLIATVEDITAQRHSQEVLQEREQHLRLIFQSVTDYAIFTIDHTGIITSWNPGAEDIFGYKASEILGHRSTELRVPEDREKKLPTLADVKPGNEERWFVRKNGERFLASGAVRPMLDIAGNLVGYTKIYRDETAQRLAEKELAEARAKIAAAAKAEHDRLADAFKRSPSFIAVLRGPEHVFELANERYYQLVGQRDILHKPAREALPEVREQGFIGLLDQVYTTGDPYVGNNIKIMLQRHPGQPLEERYVDFVYQATRDPDGAISGIFAHGVDVTERKLAEDELHRLAEQRRLALDSAKLGWWHYSLVDGNVYGDERFWAIFGANSDNLAYAAVIAQIHPDDRATVDAAVKKATKADDPQPYAIEYRVIHADGSVHWVLAKGQAYFEGVGEKRRAVSLVGTVADITDAKAAENALRESEARFRQLADAMPQIVWQADSQGHADYYNQRWYEYTGMPVGETGDQSWEPVLHPDDVQKTHEIWARSLRTSKPYEIAYRFKRASDGTYRWHLGRALPVKDEQGNVLRWFGTNTDIHDYKQLQEQNEQLLASERAARADVERASQMKDEFLATLSHELRTPLNAVLGWTQILRSGPIDPEELEDGLNTIERNARAQKQIIEDLLDMSRIISGKVRLDVQRIDLAPVVEAALDTVRPAAEAKGIRLQAVLDPHTGPVSGDPNRLHQVFWNLLTNAVKFTPRDGRIQVLLERVNSHLEVSVIDTGEGIRPEFLPHVFDRFRQADASTTRRHGGLGLGLAIVKQLVELHGGTVLAKSGGLGCGTTFTVSLPLTVIHPEPKGAVERRHPEAESIEGLDLDSCLKLDGVRVLAVDDEPDARALVKRLLENCHAVVRTAGSAREALKLFKEEQPDVLISDIGMPEEDGYALIRRIRALGPEHGGNVPALALTAYARAEDRMKAIRAGFQMHVPKPVEGAELLTMVASLAGKTDGA